MPFVDAHSHPQFPDYDNDRDVVISRAREAGIVRIVAVGTDAEDSREAVSLAERYPDLIRATVGVHPTEAPGGQADWDSIHDFARHKFVVGIGECGLDYFRLPVIPSEARNPEKLRQRDSFLKHIALAREIGKPLMIHCRSSQGTHDAHEDMYEVLSREKDLPPFIMHFFAGNVALAGKFLKLGGYFTFGGVITITHEYDDVVRSLPLERMMTETDAPFVTPLQMRGRRNEPAYVKYVLERIAELKGVSASDCAEQVLKTTDLLLHWS